MHSKGIIENKNKNTLLHKENKKRGFRKSTKVGKQSLKKSAAKKTTSKVSLEWRVGFWLCGTKKAGRHGHFQKQARGQSYPQHQPRGLGETVILQ